MTRISFAVWTPATADPLFPAGKHYPPRDLNEILYIVNHDARGYRSYLRQGHRPGEQASWTFTNCTDGTLLQHYELEEPSWTSGTFLANVRGVAVEHENEVGPWGFPQPFVITPAQVATDVRLYNELKRLCPNLRAPELGKGLEEHIRVSGGASSCPNGRITPLYTAFTTAEPEEHMGLTEDQNNRLNTIFAKVEEMWVAMFGHERDSIEKAQHREILAKLDGGGAAHGTHVVTTTIKHKED